MLQAGEAVTVSAFQPEDCPAATAAVTVGHQVVVVNRQIVAITSRAVLALVQVHRLVMSLDVPGKLCFALTAKPTANRFTVCSSDGVDLVCSSICLVKDIVRVQIACILHNT